MTEKENKEIGNNQSSTSAFDQKLLELIQESGSGTGLDWLLTFEDKLADNERKLTPSEISLIIEKIKQDIQDPDFLSFESGKIDDKDFGFEWLWDDVIPTLSPNGDCIIPVNFWYDSQRRTILLVLEVLPDWEENVYRLPEWDNHYTMKINDVEFTYQLVEHGETFRMEIRK